MSGQPQRGNPSGAFRELPREREGWGKGERKEREQWGEGEEEGGGDGRSFWPWKDSGFYSGRKAWLLSSLSRECSSCPWVWISGARVKVASEVRAHGQCWGFLWTSWGGAAEFAESSRCLVNLQLTPNFQSQIRIHLLNEVSDDIHVLCLRPLPLSHRSPGSAGSPPLTSPAPVTRYFNPT